MLVLDLNYPKLLLLKLISIFISYVYILSFNSYKKCIIHIYLSHLKKKKNHKNA